MDNKDSKKNIDESIQNDSTTVEESVSSQQNQQDQENSLDNNKNDGNDSLDGGVDNGEEKKDSSFKVLVSNVLEQASNHKVLLSVSSASLFIAILLYFTAFDKIKALKNRISNSLFGNKKNKK